MYQDDQIYHYIGTLEGLRIAHAVSLVRNKFDIKWMTAWKYVMNYQKEKE